MNGETTTGYIRLGPAVWQCGGALACHPDCVKLLREHSWSFKVNHHSIVDCEHVIHSQPVCTEEFPNKKGIRRRKMREEKKKKKQSFLIPDLVFGPSPGKSYEEGLRR